MSDIHFIFTGGTIDKTYDPSTEKPEPNTDSVIPAYFERIIKPHAKLSFETICMLDSNDITEEIRVKIGKAVQGALSSRIIIVHGTSAMTKTADYLKEILGNDVGGRTVVMVGAMIPMKEFTDSDSRFNLGYAFAQAQTLTPGIYVCMHGTTFPAGTLTKDVGNARFEPVA